jgi:hypothetical protein
MRDPGLFAGDEPTEPPVTLAVKLFHRWSVVVAEFIMKIWADTQFDDERAEQLTYWAIRELLPSPPKTMGPNALALVTAQHKILMNNAMLRSCQMPDVSRVNRGLQMMAQGLGMSLDDYCVAVAEVIDAI